MKYNIHTFWERGTLSPFELLSLNSLIANGFAVTLWSYEPVQNRPASVQEGHADLLIPESEIFYKNNSIATFTDIWRLKVINERGGAWVDLDAIATKPAEEFPQHKFLVTEDIWENSWRKDKPATITNCIIHNPNPFPGDLTDLAYQVASRVPQRQVTWSELGPNLLHNLNDTFPLNGFEIKPPHFANFYKAGEIVNKSLQDNPVPENSHFIHLYNDMWKRENINKHTLVPPKNSLLGKLYTLYL